MFEETCKGFWKCQYSSHHSIFFFQKNFRDKNDSKLSSNEIKKVTFKVHLVFEAAYLVTERFNHQIQLLNSNLGIIFIRPYN